MRTLPIAVAIATLTATACSASAPEPGSPEAIDRFCEIVGEVRDLEAEAAPATDTFVARMSTAESAQDEAAIAAAHAWGEAMIELATPSVELYEEAALLLDEPELLAGVELTIRLNEDATLSFAEQMTQVQDLDEATDLMMSFNEDLAGTITEEDAAAILALNSFSLDECGYTLREQ